MINSVRYKQTGQTLAAAGECTSGGGGGVSVINRPSIERPGKNKRSLDDSGTPASE